MICPGGKELVETALFTPIIAHGNKHYCCFFILSILFLSPYSIEFPKKVTLLIYSKAESTVRPAMLRYYTTQLVIDFVSFHYNMIFNLLRRSFS